ncbi:MAG: site-specific DNA-methyltransferase [Planctomycetaceae bacterium]|nr:site-specific DNA-methyltransferase [Planctomycetaceae bacterium]
MEDALNTIIRGDCIAGMNARPEGSVDLAFADPPFNIGYEYDQYEDDLNDDDYLRWADQWLGEIVRVLKDDGTFWLAIGDEFAAEFKVLMQRQHGLICRSWVIWYYTFGVNCKRKFSRSHAHLFHMVKDEERFTFNLDDPAVRVPSARQLVYGDRRANPKGRLPDDTWILRPQDAPDSFQPTEDTWYIPRVNGTFAERKGWHGCQMPEQILGRIIRACSNPGDLVLDPFTGSGTTLAVAKKLERDYLGFELSEQYAARAEERLASIEQGQPLDGSADPLRSVPDTKNGRKLDDKLAAGTPARKRPPRKKSAADATPPKKEANRTLFD